MSDGVIHNSVSYFFHGLIGESIHSSSSIGNGSWAVFLSIRCMQPDLNTTCLMGCIVIFNDITF